MTEEPATLSHIEQDLARITQRGDKRLRQYLADVPDPREYAYRLPSPYAELLMSARRNHSTLMVTMSVAKELRPLGLVDYVTTNLTAFGAAVYRELTEAGDA